MGDIFKNELKPAFVQTRLYYMYFMQYSNLFCSRFLWKNLPDEIYAPAIEKILLTGRLIFLKDDNIDMFAVMPEGDSGKFDIYGFGEERMGMTAQYVEFRNKENSVILQDNIMGMCPAELIQLKSVILAEMEMVKRTNINAQKTPVVISGPKSIELTSNNFINQVESNIPVIKLNDNILGDKINIQALNVRAEYVADKISMEMEKERSELLTFMGIDSHVDSKKERLVSNEVFSNNGQIELYRKNSLDLRKRFCENVNKLFGLNIDVEFNSDIPIIPSEFLNMKEGGENSPIYDDN